MFLGIAFGWLVGGRWGAAIVTAFVFVGIGFLISYWRHPETIVVAPSEHLFDARGQALPLRTGISRTRVMWLLLSVAALGTTISVAVRYREPAPSSQTPYPSRSQIPKGKSEPSGEESRKEPPRVESPPAASKPPEPAKAEKDKTKTTVERPPQTGTDPEIAKVRTDATGLIHKLWDSYKHWNEKDQFWGGRAGTIPTNATRRYQLRNNQDFTSKYRQTYEPQIVDVRNRLLAHIRELPTPPLNWDRERIYNIGPMPDGTMMITEVINLICDLRLLLNQLERENNLQLSCRDIKLGGICDFSR